MPTRTSNTSSAALGRRGRALAVAGRAQRHRQSRYLVYGAAAIGAVLVLVVWVFVTVRTTVIAQLEDRLTDAIDIQTEAVRLWARSERDVVRSWAEQPDLKRAVATLRPDPENADSIEQTTQALAGLLQSEQVVLYLVVDDDFSVAISSLARQTGITESGRAIVASALAGETRVSAPVRSSNLLVDARDLPRNVLVQSAPIVNTDGANIATLLILNTTSEFSRIVALSRHGRTGDTYAFGPDGWMLSESRHLDELSDKGVLVDPTQSSAVLNLQIRDPGRSLTRANSPAVNPDGWPLTRMAESAIAGIAGVEVEPYRDYRGVEVVGAWRWLDDLGFGIATEIEAREALNALRPLLYAVIGLALVPFVFIPTIGGFTWMIRRLNREFEEAVQLGQYLLTEKIGEGGMGEVYRARHCFLRRPVAVKVFRSDIGDDKALARFEREVQLTSQLKHPNTVRIYDYGRTDEDLFYYAMEFIDGYDLSQMLEREQFLPPGRVVHILRQVALSLREAHDLGLIHRDIKPMNVILCARGGEYDAVKVLDFGLVKEIAPSGPDALTMADVIPGTPAYIPPERMRPAGREDVRSDIYSLAAVGFNLLTGKPVFDGESGIEICHKILSEERPRCSAVAQQAIPQSLDDFLYMALAREREQRPPDIRSFLEQLDSLTDVVPWTAPQARAWWEANPIVAGAETGIDIPRIESHA